MAFSTSAHRQRMHPLERRNGLGKTPRLTSSSTVLSAQSSSRARVPLERYDGGRGSAIFLGLAILNRGPSWPSRPGTAGTPLEGGRPEVIASSPRQPAGRAPFRAVRVAGPDDD